MNDQRPRLMLFSSPIADAAAFCAPLREALTDGDVAAVALDLAGIDERVVVKMAKVLVPLIQTKEAAALLVDRPGIVTRAGADGAHIVDPGALAAAFEALAGQGKIVGAGGLRLRDEAMSAAEQGVDYVLFGGKDADGRDLTIEAVLEKAAWWAEIFEIPCVAFAPSLEAIPELAATGAEFIALGEAVWEHPQGPRAAVATASRLMSRSLVA